MDGYRAARDAGGNDRTVRRRRLALLAAITAAALAVVWQREDGGLEVPTPEAVGFPTSATSAPSAPTTTQPTGPPDQATLDSVSLRLTPVIALAHPTAVAQRPGTQDLYATALAAAIVRAPIGGGEAVAIADWGPQISTEGESGLLDLAFDADGSHLYLSMVLTNGDLALLEVPFVADSLAVDQARTVLAVPSPTNIHHAGDVAVDPDGLVWFSIGDGGPVESPTLRAQDLNDLHGKLLRIDPRSSAAGAYGIPPDNPFVGRADARPEIWSYGLRNPWRFDIDPVTGSLWIGDVGRYGAEEVDHVPGPRAGAGGNFGWPYLEGADSRRSGAPEGLVGPLLSYPHGDRCAVTGGSVYRGAAIPGLVGAYLYSDLCDGVVRSVAVGPDGAILAERSFTDTTAGYPVSFGTDLAGEMYVCSFDAGTIYRIDPGP